MFIRKNIVSYKDLITKYGIISQLSGYNYMVGPSGLHIGQQNFFGIYGETVSGVYRGR